MPLYPSVKTDGFTGKICKIATCSDQPRFLWTSRHMTQIDSQWLHDTLTDAAETLAKAIALIEEDPRKARGVLEHEIPELYAKLNYAVNTAEAGPNAINEMDHDELDS